MIQEPNRATAHATEPLLEKLETTIRGLVWAKRRHPILAATARELDLLMTGGSDFHGDPAHGREPGGISLPAVEFERLCEARPNADS